MWVDSRKLEVYKTECRRKYHGEEDGEAFSESFTFTQLQEQGYSSEREAKKALKVIAEFIKNSSDPRFPGSSLSFMGLKLYENNLMEVDNQDSKAIVQKGDKGIENQEQAKEDRKTDKESPDNE